MTHHGLTSTQRKTMTTELEDRILSLFAEGAGWEDATALIALDDWSQGRAESTKPSTELRTSVQNLWREYVSGKDKA